MARSKQTLAKVIQDKDAPVEKPVLAQAIIKISVAFTRLLESGLNERAVVAFVADATTVGRPDIRAVLASLKVLAKDYCR